MATIHGQEIAVIFNPASGLASRRALGRRLCQLLSDKGCKVAIHSTRNLRHAYELACRFGKHAQVVVVIGGDGTVNQVANGLIGTDTPMCIVPTGTENLLARHLGIRAKLDAIIESIESKRFRHLDVANVNGRNFLSTAGVGFDGQVVRRLNAIRNTYISHMSYFWPIWRTFWQYDYPAIRVEADGELLCDEPALAFVCNIRRYAVGLQICPLSRFDDGLLDLCVYRCAGRLRLVGHSVRTVLKRHLRSNRVIYRQCKTVTVHSRRPLEIQTDGDPAGQTPAVFTIRERALRILVQKNSGRNNHST